MGKELTIMPRVYDLILWYSKKITYYPKKYKYNLGERITDLFLGVIENIIEAQYSQKKYHFLRKTNIVLEKLRLMVRLSKDLQCISLNEYEYLAKEINEIGKMVGGWEKYSKGKEYGEKI